MGRCWLCSARDRELDLRTVRGRLYLEAVETDFDARNGRAPAPGSLPPPLEAAWRVVVTTRLEWENEEHERLTDEARRKAGKR